MKLLGAVLAGGASRRFGSDKALALLDGTALIDHVIAALAPQVADLVICGRVHPPWASLADLPAPGLGPLGGLCAALAHAVSAGHDAVLCVPCDAPHLPGDLARRLGHGPSVALGQRSVGVWPAALAPALRDHLAAAGDLSLRRWIAVSGASECDGGAIANINRPGDLTPCRSD
ncbi:hypothetical protein IP88_00080 [alpha proteobacterium AAP81b]|nr:hypothetical protein IP88_00080 [alpha proteobacterium AAP81b]